MNNKTAGIHVYPLILIYLLIDSTITSAKSLLLINDSFRTEFGSGAFG